MSKSPKTDGTYTPPGRAKVPPPSLPPSLDEIVAEARNRLAGKTRRPGQRVGLIWAAVSEDKGQTTDGQISELMELADRMGLFVPPEHVLAVEESRFIGKVPPAKKRVLEMAHERRFDVLLVWKLDRWSRDRHVGAKEVFEVLPACGVTVVSKMESFLSTEGMDPFFREWVGRLLLYIGEKESTDKRDRTLLKYRTKANRAAALGERAKWGRGHVLNDADKARILELAASMGVRAIARETGFPKSTVARVVSQSSARDGTPPRPGDE